MENEKDRTKDDRPHAHFGVKVFGIVVITAGFAIGYWYFYLQ